MFRNTVPLALLALVTVSACSDDARTPTAPQPTDAKHYTAPSEPVNGELIRQNGDLTVWLSYNRTLYGIPDQQTLRACTGGRENVVRVVSSLPAWPKGPTIPSAGDPRATTGRRDWLFGDNPVQNSSGTVFVVVGCVKSGIPNPDVYNAMFNGDWSRIRTVADADLNALPTGPVAQGYPLRRAGTLLETGGTVRWVTFHGGSLALDAASTMDSYCRAWSEMTSGSSDYYFYTMNGVLQPGPGPGNPVGSACVRGNDYPYANQSYGTYRSTDIDPWNFYYRECTSFVAWRLNQDGIPFNNTYRQPSGYRWSNAWLWDDAAIRAGVRMDHTPERGAVAQWDWGGSSGHVAYVVAVNNDGTVTLEEYNRNFDGMYGTRYSYPAASVHNYIHFR